MKDLSKHWSEFVELFCDKDIISSCHKPFKLSDYNSFYDWKVAVLVKSELMGREAEPHKTWETLRLGNLNKISSIDAFQVSTFLDNIPKVKERKTKKIKCPECNGEGVVEFEYESFYPDEDGKTTFTVHADCPLCEATGFIYRDVETDKMVIDESAVFRFSGHEGFFSVVILMKLLRLMNLVDENRCDIMCIDDKLVIDFDNDVMLLSSPEPGDKEHKKVYTFNLTD